MSSTGVRSPFLEGPMKTLLAACLVALALGAGTGSAAERLSDTQMDQISAGAPGLLPTSCDGAPACGIVTVTSTSSVTTVANSMGMLQTMAKGVPIVTCGTGCIGAPPL